MYELDLFVRALPSCRTVWQAGDSYCAAAKILKGVGVPVPILGHCIHPETIKFIEAVSNGLVNKAWLWDVQKLNDSHNGNFRENHARAFEMAVERCLKSGVVKLKIGSVTDIKESVCDKMM